jgi:predicted ATPase/Tfp pilus assembly protein PilF
MLSLFLLGPCQVFLDGRPLKFRTNKALALLCYLAAETTTHPGIAVRRELLMELLWPDMPSNSAQDNLRQTLYQLRKAVPEAAVPGKDAPQPFILSNRLTIQINPDCTYDLDLADFQNNLASDPTPDQLEAAVAPYRGDFLTDLYLADSNTFEEWAAARRLKMRGQALDALDKLTTHFTGQGNFEQAERYARQQLEIDNLLENAHRQLMTIFAQSGRRRQAIQQYELCRRLLSDELGVDPAAETTALHERIRSAGRRAPRHNLPAQTTTFVGRQQELAEVIRLLKEPGCRLLTLVGPGGIGKTRLSLQVAASLAEGESEFFPNGIYFVSLAAVPTIENLVPAVAEAVGFSFSGPREPKSQLLHFLQSKELLLVLDNMEQLVNEAALLAEMLAVVPGLTFLVTSRARLNLYEEWRLELHGLEVPVQATEAGLERYSAVQLFIERARQANLAFSPARELPAIGQICQLLAGMPLAIELAAGWVRTHTCRQIVIEIERGLDFLITALQNVPERHRSLHVTFEHSWRLLPAKDQSVFARLTIFRDGFNREAARAVAGASPVALAELVDNSMLHVADGRYQMNELLRQLGSEKLVEVTAADVRQRHAAYYAAYVQQREVFKWTGQEPATLDEISLELQNILAGWRWAISHLEDPAQIEANLNLIGRYAPMLAHFYDQRNRFHEGTRLFQQAAARIEAARQSATHAEPFAIVLAQVQTSEAAMRFHLSQFMEVEKLVENSLTIFRRADKRRETAEALDLLGRTHNRLGAFEEANRSLQESLSLFRQIEARIAGAEAINGLGIVAVSQERFDDGRSLLEESLAIYKETGYQKGIARALSNLGTVNVRSGRFENALPLYKEALAAAKTIDDVMVSAAVTTNMGSISRILGDYENGVRYYEESLAMFQELGERRWIAVCLNGQGETLLDMGRIDQAEIQLQKGLEISTAIQSIPDVLDSLAALGEITATTGDLEKAAEIASFVRHHPVTKPLARGRSERVLAQLKDKMPVGAWETAQERGQEETLEGLTAAISF